MFDRQDLERQKQKQADDQSRDPDLAQSALDFIVDSDRYGYAYQWTWLGLPIIQLPQDIVATQEIIWATKPDLVIETGIAWGGSVVLYASILQLLGKGAVVGVDLNLMDHVRREIMTYPFSDRIRLYKGSSTDPEIAAQVKSHVRPGISVMLILDSNHTHAHVLEELGLYAPLVTKGQYLVVSDTVVENMPVQAHRPRPWGPGSNPMTALREYLATTDRFALDERLNKKLLLTYSPDGYYQCIKE